MASHAEYWNLAVFYVRDCQVTFTCFDDVHWPLVGHGGLREFQKGSITQVGRVCGDSARAAFFMPVNFLRSGSPGDEDLEMP